MKRSELMFSFLLVPVDYAMIVFAGLCVYFFRYNTFLAQLRPPVFDISIFQYFKILVLVAFFWIPIFALAGMYSVKRSRKITQELSATFLATSAGLILIVLVIFFRHELFGSRFLVLAGYITAFFFVFFGRVGIRKIQRSFYKKNIGVSRAVVFGQSKSTESFISGLKKDKSSGYVVVRHFKRIDDSSLSILETISKKMSADVVILADYNHGRREALRLYEFCQENHLDFSYAADVLEAKSQNVEVGEMCGVPVVHIKRTSLDGWGRISKRFFDIVFSSLALFLLSPVFAFCAIIIKMDSEGEIFVKLTRIGDGGKKFKLYKFRSMIKNAHSLKSELLFLNERADGPLFKMKNDPRVTKFGRFMRKWSIDEFPNFINVLLGDISLVGPRPHEEEEVNKYSGYQRRLLNIKPGVTGLAQISGRSDLTFGEEAMLDLFYIENWSLWLDFTILLRTPWVVVFGKNAS